MPSKEPFTCPNCGFTVPYMPGQYDCICGVTYRRDGKTEINPILAGIMSCPHLGEVVGEIDPKHCGCGMNKAMTVHRCKLHGTETTPRKIPNYRQRRERNCWECIDKKENEFQ